MPSKSLQALKPPRICASRDTQSHCVGDRPRVPAPRALWASLKRSLAVTFVFVLSGSKTSDEVSIACSEFLSPRSATRGGSRPLIDSLATNELGIGQSTFQNP
jgi:hypothetical protein